MPKPDFSNKKDKVAEIIRVNHAGEYGAKRIYEGQINWSRNPEEKALMTSMLKQEQVHLDYFDKYMQSSNIRPTFMMPLWHIGGYALGAISALIGPKTAMLVTEGVEEVITDHYQEQIDYLETTEEKDLLSKLQEFRYEEIEHRHTAIEHGSKHATLAPLALTAVKTLCKIAIYISKKI